MRIYITILLFLIFTNTIFLSKVKAYEFINTYPYGNQENRPDEDDPWGWGKWNCTSYAGWKVRESLIPSFTNGYTYNNLYVVYGNAHNWNDAASLQGFTTTSTPSTHSVAVWEAWTTYAPSQYGHVAWVEKVNNTSLTVSHYNLNYDGSYHETTFEIGGQNSPTSFIIFGSTSCNNTISNITISSGQSLNCSLQSINVLPTTEFRIGSNVNLKSY